MIFIKNLKKKLHLLITNKPTIMEKINGQTAKNGVVIDTTSNVQPI